MDGSTNNHGWLHSEEIISIHASKCMRCGIPRTELPVAQNSEIGQEFRQGHGIILFASAFHHNLFER